MTTEEKLEKLRNEMIKRNISAWIIPSEDFHGSEYVGDYFKARAYLSGFTGSAGTLVVTLEKAALWTDGRYFLQAAQQLNGTTIELMKTGEPQVPTIPKWLADECPINGTIGFDGRTISAVFFDELMTALEAKNISFLGNEDLIDIIWKDRPSMSKKPVWALPAGVTGLTRTEKLQKVREEMWCNNCEMLILSSLEETAWLLNLRGNDVAYTPVFLSYMIITPEEAKVFAYKEVFSDTISAELGRDGILLAPYDSFIDTLRQQSEGRTVWADKKKTSYCVIDALSSAHYLKTDATPVDMLKAIKTPEEQDGMIAAHIRDGAAVTHFMYWLKKNIGTYTISEISAAEKLLEFRKMQPDFLDESFSPIMGYGDHGAIIHYSATPESNVPLQAKGLFLCDTGAHFRMGTTDITRTLVLGPVSEEEKKCFTLVLKGHLALGFARFKKGCYGASLDYAARLPLWEAGMDYNHGTGHGVGFILSVHEGPQRIHYGACKDSPARLKAGMIISNEPGLYLENKFGIRHENLMLCVEDICNEYGQFLKFRPLTMVPIDKDGLDLNLMTESEKEKLNAYHAAVFEAISYDFSGEELNWLREATSPIM